MGFRPAGDRHAIQEVVFILNFNRMLEAVELDRFQSQHEYWKAELPRGDRPAMVQLFLGPGVPNGPPPPAVFPVVFQSFRRDGGLDWQMQANQNWLAVNCLSYTRWDAVFAQAFSLLFRGMKDLKKDDLYICSITLQYIDQFIWDGQMSEYDISEIIDRNSGYFPAAFSCDGPAWHLHSGAYDLSAVPATGRRVMRRVHLDAQIDNGTANTRMDVSLTADYLQSEFDIRPIDWADVHAEFEALHLENKKIMREILPSEMQDKISLSGSSE